MPTNRPSEDRYIMPTPTAEDAEYLGSEQSRKDRRNVQRQMTDEEVEAHNNRIMERANRPSVIEKLTAPPETLKQHAEREGFTVDEHYWVRTDTASETTWEERLRISRPSSEPAQVINVPDEWEIR